MEVDVEVKSYFHGSCRKLNFTKFVMEVKFTSMGVFYFGINNTPMEVTIHSRGSNNILPWKKKYTSMEVTIHIYGSKLDFMEASMDVAVGDRCGAWD